MPTGRKGKKSVNKKRLVYFTASAETGGPVGAYKHRLETTYKGPFFAHKKTFLQA